MPLFGRIRYGAGNVPRRLPVFVASVALAAAAVGAGAAHATPFAPDNDALVLEHIPEARDAAGAGLRALHTALLADPHNLSLAIRTAEADLQQARALGDPRFVGRADAALAMWPLGPATPPNVLVLRAIMLQTIHEFDASIVALDQALRAEPANGRAWLVRAAVHLAQGRVSAAGQDCGQYATAAIGLLADSCVAGVMAANGNAPAAMRALSLALAADTAEPAAARLYAMTIAAETAAALGDASAADRFGQALAVDANDPYLLAAWSDFLLDHGRAAEVVTLLAGRTRIDPLLLRLTLAEHMLGQGRDAAHIADLAARFDAARSRGETVHRREEAMFRLHVLGDAAGALALARANWDVQREPADARILLQAAVAAGDPKAAQPVTQWMHQTGLQDVRLSVLVNELQSTGAVHDVL